ncbi:MAG: Dam family site-specific DNA-(adenine-N6)-methyltransferase [Deltaproteobacteria bacterium]|jgi:DNA adenine methylase|nr:Dam family site-specific DNA-(adenine-N6)-methyltransferase [Deltaproteobacteria bacterium]
MNNSIPHIIQYQGSKRLLSPQILTYMPLKFNRLLEPFAGMAAITIATAIENRATQYFINDINKPLISILEMAINYPKELIHKYEIIWSDQFNFEYGSLNHFYFIRDSFNFSEQTPDKMLYLLARCVKGAVRYSKNGKFNQSPDKRRHGTNPTNLAKNVKIISAILKGKTFFSALDYREFLNIAKPGDIVYMDPPYHGVSQSRDSRYFGRLNFQHFIESIEFLNKKDIDFIISYDGESGEKKYGIELPKYLNCSKILLNAGLSTQSILLGKKNITLESLYISNKLFKIFNSNSLLNLIPS